MSLMEDCDIVDHMDNDPNFYDGYKFRDKYGNYDFDSHNDHISNKTALEVLGVTVVTLGSILVFTLVANTIADAGTSERPRTLDKTPLERTFVSPSPPGK